jgi:hypothetical protein
MAIGRKTGGREKGAPNKTTKALKELILGALSDAGGQQYLVRMAERRGQGMIFRDRAGSASAFRNWLVVERGRLLRFSDFPPTSACMFAVILPYAGPWRRLLGLIT